MAPPRHDISSGKDAGNVGLHASFTTIVFLRPNSKPWMEVGTIGLGDTPTATMAMSMSSVSVAPRYRFRTAATAGIRFAQLHLLQDHLFHRTLFVGYVFQRVVQGEELDTLFLGVLHLFERAASRFRTAIDNHHPFRTQALAVRQESMAVLPPPTTMTFLANGWGYPYPD